MKEGGREWVGVQIPTLTQQNFNFRSITHTTNIADEYEFRREKDVFFYIILEF